MREIKFRGKRIDNGEWVYGSYHCTNTDGYLRYFILPEKDWKYNFEYEVDPETIGQYTGLKDKKCLELSTQFYERT